MICSAFESMALVKANPAPGPGWWVNDAGIPSKTPMRSLRIWLARKIHRFALWIAPVQPVKWRQL